MLNIGNDSISHLPIINSEVKDYDHDSWIDMEPDTGIVLGLNQKYLVSVLIERDDLFDIDDKFIPIYKFARSGNHSDVNVIF